MNHDQHASHDIRVLNSLIETTLDSADGYREAAKETNNPGFRRMFEERSFERQQVTTDLQSVVRTLGAEPEDDGSILAAAHRAFLDVKHAVLHDEQAVVNSVENGEDFIKAKFEKAMRDDELPPQAREAVSRAYESIRADHDEISRLKHSMH